MQLLHHVLGNHSNLIGNNYKFSCRLIFLQISLLLLISESLSSFTVKYFRHSCGQKMLYCQFVSRLFSSQNKSLHISDIPDNPSKLFTLPAITQLFQSQLFVSQRSEPSLSAVVHKPALAEIFLITEGSTHLRNTKTFSDFFFLLVFFFQSE